MDLHFTRTGALRYAVTARRHEHPDLVCSPAPGFDERIPHDLVHLEAERRWTLRDGIYGALAAGGDAGTFLPADGHYDRRYARRTARRSPPGRDLARSEELAALLPLAWCRRHGLGERDTLPAHAVFTAGAGELEAARVPTPSTTSTRSRAAGPPSEPARRWSSPGRGRSAPPPRNDAAVTAPADRRVVPPDASVSADVSDRTVSGTCSANQEPAAGSEPCE